MFQPLYTQTQLVNHPQQSFRPSPPVQRSFPTATSSQYGFSSSCNLASFSYSSLALAKSFSSNVNQAIPPSSALMPNSPLPPIAANSHSNNDCCNPTELEDMDTSDDDSLFIPSSPTKSEDIIDMCWEPQNDSQCLSLLPRELLLQIFRMVIYTDYLTAKTAHWQLAKLSLVRRSWCSLARLTMHENIELQWGKLDMFAKHLQANSHIGPLVRSLDVRSIYFGPKKVIPILNECPMLQHFSCDPVCYWENEAMEELDAVFEVLGSMKSFVSLDLGCWDPSHPFEFSLDVLRPLSGLRHLKLSQWTAIERLGKEPPVFPRLRTFTLLDSKLDEAHASDLLNILRNATDLQALALVHLDSPVEVLSHIFLSTAPALRALRYEPKRECLGDGFVLTTAVQRFRQLRELRCRGSNFPIGPVPVVAPTIEVVWIGSAVSTAWYQCWVSYLLSGLYPGLQYLVVDRPGSFDNDDGRKLVSLCGQRQISTKLPPHYMCTLNNFMYEAS